MRMRTLSLILILALLLVACGPQETAPPSDAPVDNNAQAEAEATAEATAPAFIIVTPLPPTLETEGALDIPGVGTLIASETEDPNLGQPFDVIYLIRTSGEEAAVDLELELNSDGSYIRNGTPGIIQPEQVAEITRLMDELNFFGMQATMLGASAEDIANRYSVTVMRAGQSRSINSQDAYMPDAYVSFLAAVIDVGLRPS